jgi:hypothetical protein
MAVTVSRKISVPGIRSQVQIAGVRRNDPGTESPNLIFETLKAGTALLALIGAAGRSP